MTGANVGPVDMNVRGFVGTLSMAFASISFFLLAAPARYLAGLAFAGLAFSAFATAYTRRCPIYRALGLSTARS